MTRALHDSCMATPGGQQGTSIGRDTVMRAAAQHLPGWGCLRSIASGSGAGLLQSRAACLFEVAAHSVSASVSLHWAAMRHAGRGWRRPLVHAHGVLRTLRSTAALSKTHHRWLAAAVAIPAGNRGCICAGR
ncbi:hypothetical protein EIJ12_08925 [Xanthomonas perforans]|nr:hypothetical protein BJD13_12755 [Xanthomonas perforans]AQS76322.1 hypothetical protein XPE_08425 [Xanthomonas perforans 91-118]RXD38279.1 hypothetical protein DB854_02745 [Xanthomonas perforans]RXD40174.1 hypothetical protein DB761_19285 [Xanthomonas perforans]RXD41875.1 hypothetical protein DB757_09115 [Xanthomonas perforans]